MGRVMGHGGDVCGYGVGVFEAGGQVWEAACLVVVVHPALTVLADIDARLNAVMSSFYFGLEHM